MMVNAEARVPMLEWNTEERKSLFFRNNVITIVVQQNKAYIPWRPKRMVESIY